jgi:UDP-glucose 4,6-dehydratase
MTSARYVPKSLLVTGGCGFIGSNFINHVLETYPEVRVVNLDRLDYCADRQNVTETPNYTLVVGDLNDKDLVLHILQTHEIDTVVHFAAQTHVDNSFGNSIQFTMDNVLGTHTLLECCRVYNAIKRFIHISTDEVYGEVDLEHPGCNEKSLLNPTNPYAATKAGAEFIVRSYYYSFGMPIIITRGNNVYGPRQYPEKLIPRFIKLLKEGKKCTIHGAGESRRNFIYVSDVARAVVAIMQHGQLNSIYNIGSDNEYSVMDIATKLVSALAPGKQIEDMIEYVEDRNFNDYRYAIDSKALRDLGWQEETSFEDGLRKTIEWYV